MSSLASINRVASTLKRFVNATQPAKGQISEAAFNRAVKASKLSAADKALARTFYGTAIPGGMEFRVDPSRDNILHAIDVSVKRLKDADLRGNGDRFVDATEMVYKNGKPWVGNKATKKLDAVAAGR